MNPSASRPFIYLIDGHSFVYRAFHAIPYLSNSQGHPTNAILGFTQMLLKILKERKPEYLAIAFDHGGKTLRHEVFEDYKVHRPAMPEALCVQLPDIYRLVEALRIPLLMMKGYEADDVLATLVQRAAADGYEVTIVSGDKDFLQLVRPSVRMYDSMRDLVMGEEEVENRFGVKPEKIPEVMGLMGDASDNIPGVPGVGEKTAAGLIQEFGGIEALRDSLDRVQKPKLRENLRQHIDLALLSRDLATLHTDLPLEIDLHQLKVQEPDRAALVDLFREWEFHQLLRDFAPPPPSLGGRYEIVEGDSSWTRMLLALQEAGHASLSLHTTSADPKDAQLLGIAFAAKEQEAYYVPWKPGPGDSLASEALWNRLKEILEGPGFEKFGHDLKFAYLILQRHGVTPAGWAFDTMVASYLLHPARSNPSLEDICLDSLRLHLRAAAGERRGEEMSSGVPAQVASSCARADAILQLVTLLRPQLAERNLDALFDEIEMPLIEVLAAIERNGFKLDERLLREMSRELERDLEGIARRIYDLAKGEFNINSPKQLSEVLFRRLGLTPLRRTKTGFSTEVDVLEQLAQQHPLPAEILQYRSLAKLKSTYVDVLPQLIHPETGRIHTSLHQTVTATGRLSSSEPNLQNIPVRGEVGSRIREAFVAGEGCRLLSADYSQIELRILAHLSGDEALIESFRRGEDVHARTAAQIWGVPSLEVPPEMRRMAKTINFGIIYGMSPYGLAAELGTSQGEARKYIEQYFAHYRGVRAFIDTLLQETRASGLVKTLFGRRRPIPHLQSPDAATRQLGERMAINTPIQGSAADLIKKAMVSIYHESRRRGYATKMILQVHDELVFEVPEKEEEEVRAMVQAEMEGVIQLKVPIRVEIGVGKNWREAHP